MTPAFYLHSEEKGKGSCGAPIAPAHVGLSKNTATRETKNEIEGIVSIKRIEHQPTSGKVSQWFETFAARENWVAGIMEC